MSTTEIVSYASLGAVLFKIAYDFIKDKKNNAATMLKESEKKLRIELMSKDCCSAKMEKVLSTEEMVKTLFNLVKEFTANVKELTAATTKLSKQIVALETENKLRREYEHDRN